MTQYGVISQYNPMTQQAYSAPIVPNIISPQSPVQTSYSNPYTHNASFPHQPLNQSVSSFSPTPVGITTIPPPPRSILRTKPLSPIIQTVQPLSPSVTFNNAQLVQTVQYQRQNYYCDECFCSLI